MKYTTEEVEASTAGVPAPEPGPARAPEPRINGLFPAQVRGVDASGRPFHTQTLMDNFGASRFDLRLPLRVEPGEQLFVVADIYEATVALHGEVLRAEPQPGGAYLMTINVRHYRFL